MFGVGRVGFVGQQYTNGAGASGGPTYVMDFTNQPAGVTPAGVIFTRASAATYFDASGVRQTAGNDVIRFDYNPTTLQPRGFLIEGARTNFLLNSNTPATQTVALSTGTFTLWIEGTGSATIAANTAVGSGFGVATAASPQVVTITTAGTVDVTLTGTVTVFQLENGPFPSSLIITTGASATRAGDLGSILTATMGFNANEGTLLVEFELYSTSGNRMVAGFYDGTNLNSMTHGVFGGDNSWSIRVANVLTANLSMMPASTPANGIVKQVGTYKVNDIRAARTGVLATPVTSTNLPTVTTLYLGRRTADQQLFGWLRKVTYYNTALPDAQLQSMTL